MMISGAVGYSLLKDNSKDLKILILSDVHSDVKYCNDNSQYVSEYLKSRLDNNKILLEESTMNVKLKSLWPDSQHTSLLQDLAINEKEIYSFDIRPLLIPFSWEIMDSNKFFGLYTLRKYLQNVEDFFNQKSVLFKDYIHKELLMLKCKRKKKKHYLHLKELYSQFVDFKKKFSKYLDEDLNKINKNILEEFNDYISNIMEWYVILLILNSKKNVILHLGLAHSSKINLILKKYYNFEQIEFEGINFFDELPKNFHLTDNVIACIKIPKL